MMKKEHRIETCQECITANLKLTVVILAHQHSHFATANQKLRKVYKVFGKISAPCGQRHQHKDGSSYGELQWTLKETVVTFL